VEIILHAHHAEVSQALRARAERALAKIATRLKRAVAAVIRFEADSGVMRVELVLQSPRRRDLVAEGLGKDFGPALTKAVSKLDAQVRAERIRTDRERRAGRRIRAA
jgi:ribosome-associated translation inhibitor RaiA